MTYVLKDLLKIRNGRDHKQLADGPIPVYGSGGIMRYASSALYDKTSILLPRKGTLDNIQFTTKPFWTVDTLYYTEIDESKANPYFLFYYLKQLDISRLWTGTGVPSMTNDAYYQVKVSLPDLPTQHHIASILGSLDEKIEINRKKIEKLEALARMIYEHWFVQFDFPDANGKPYKSSGGAMVWNEELKQEVPNGWQIDRLSTIIARIGTGLNPRDHFKFGGTIKYLTVKNITANGEIDFSGCDFVDEEAKKIIHARSDIKTGDILFASIEPLGRCFLIHKTPIDWDINESIFTIRPNAQKTTSEYMLQYFMSEYFIAMASKQATGSIFKGIRISELLNMKTFIVPMKIVQDFTKTIKKVICQKNTASSEIEKLIALRDWLLPMLMNGQVTVGE